MSDNETNIASDPPPLPAKADNAPNAVSLSNELDVLRYAVRAAGVLVDTKRHGDCANAADEAAAPRACSAVLNLVETRMALVVQTITGQVEPERLSAHYNMVHADAQRADPEDIVLLLDDDEGTGVLGTMHLTPCKSGRS